MLAISLAEGMHHVTLSASSPWGCFDADTFLKIPQHLLLHAGHCKEDAALGQAFSKLRTAAGAEMDDRHLLCLLLIVERAKGAKSRWHQYINYLPQSYSMCITSI